MTAVYEFQVWDAVVMLAFGGTEVYFTAKGSEQKGQGWGK